jgi:glutaconate CoA-transferase, subunit A
VSVGRGAPEDKVTSLEKLAAAIPEGALVTFSGFDLNRAPMAVVMEILRQGRRGLRVVTLPNPLPLDLLVGAGAVAEAEFGFLGFQYDHGFVVAPNVRRAIEQGTIAWRERDVYEIVQGLRAAAFGVPFLPAPGGEGSDYRRVNGTPTMKDPSSGDETLIAAAIRPEVALLHVQAADRRGNLFVSDLFAEDLLARAAVKVLATAEKVVERLERPTIPGRLVERVAEVRGGAFPTSCHGHYPFSAAHLREYVDLAAEGRFADYLRKYVTVPGGRAFAESAGEARGRGAFTVYEAPPASDRATAADRLVVSMARCIADGEVVATGVASALPMLAIALARETRAPRLTYINCVGAINPKLASARVTSVDVGLLDACAATVTLPEMFDLARQGKIERMFFGASQIDREGRTNLTCIGDYARPKVKLPGPAGSSSMRAFVPRVVIGVPRHSPRTLVTRVDFATSVASSRNRETLVLTDLAILRLEEGALRLVSRHAGVSAEDLAKSTGFPLDGDAATTLEPTVEEMEALRRLDPTGIRHRLV